MRSGVPQTFEDVDFAGRLRSGLFRFGGHAAKTAHDAGRTPLRIGAERHERFCQGSLKGADSELGKTHDIVLWLTQHFAWKETDYKKRTVQQIVARGRR